MYGDFLPGDTQTIACRPAAHAIAHGLAMPFGRLRHGRTAKDVDASLSL